MGKLNLYTISPKWEVRGARNFSCSWGLRVLKNKILASGLKGSILSVSKNFSETSGQIFTKFLGFWGVIPKIFSAKYGGDLTTQLLGEAVENFQWFSNTSGIVMMS